MSRPRKKALPAPTPALILPGDLVEYEPRRAPFTRATAIAQVICGAAYLAPPDGVRRLASSVRLLRIRRDGEVVAEVLGSDTGRREEHAARARALRASLGMV